MAEREPTTNPVAGADVESSGGDGAAAWLHRTTKALRMDYTRLKKRLPAGTEAPRQPAFLELLASPATGPVECVVELESAGDKLRVSMKGAALDWGSLLHAWRGASR